MILLSADDLRKALPMREAIAAMKEAFGALSSGKATAPLRTRLEIPRHGGVILFMPAYLDADEAEPVALKAVSVFPQNREAGMPTIHAAVLLVDGTDGRPQALIEGSALTAIRTGAASGLATEYLARPESSILAIIGAGVQARTQAEAVCTVRAIDEVRVYAPA